jgi:hypothetical protein
MENPFRSSAGATPPEIIGRSGLLDEFDYGLSPGSGAPGPLTIFTGARGTGKTVMPGAAHDLAREHGWAVTAETATEGIPGRTGESMRPLAEEPGTGPQVRRITAIAAAGFSPTTQLPPERQVTWRTISEEPLRQLAARNTGLVITVNEIHAANRGEPAQPAASVQHFIQDRLPIGPVFAGLPAAASDLLNEGAATSLPCTDKTDLHTAAIRDAETSLTATFTTAGLTVPAGPDPPRSGDHRRLPLPHPTGPILPAATSHDTKPKTTTQPSPPTRPTRPTGPSKQPADTTPAPSSKPPRPPPPPKNLEFLHAMTHNNAPRPPATPDTASAPKPT